MPTKFRLVLLVALVLASLGFSAYGVALASPSMGISRLANSLAASEASGTLEMVGTPEATESPEVTESPEASGSPEVSGTPEPTDTPDVLETHDAKDMQPQDGNIGPPSMQNQDTQGPDQNGDGEHHDGRHDGGGDGGSHQEGGGGESLSPWALSGGRY